MSIGVGWRSILLQDHEGDTKVLLASLFRLFDTLQKQFFFPTLVNVANLRSARRRHFGFSEIPRVAPHLPALPKARLTTSCELDITTNKKVRAGACQTLAQDADRFLLLQGNLGAEGATAS